MSEIQAEIIRNPDSELLHEFIDYGQSLYEGKLGVNAQIPLGDQFNVLRLFDKSRHESDPNSIVSAREYELIDDFIAFSGEMAGRILPTVDGVPQRTELTTSVMRDMVYAYLERLEAAEQQTSAIKDGSSIFSTEEVKAKSYYQLVMDLEAARNPGSQKVTVLTPAGNVSKVPRFKTFEPDPTVFQDRLDELTQYLIERDFNTEDALFTLRQLDKDLKFTGAEVLSVVSGISEHRPTKTTEEILVETRIDNPKGSTAALRAVPVHSSDEDLIEAIKAVVTYDNNSLAVIPESTSVVSKSSTENQSEPKTSRLARLGKSAGKVMLSVANWIKHETPVSEQANTEINTSSAQAPATQERAAQPVAPQRRPIKRLVTHEATNGLSPERASLKNAVEAELIRLGAGGENRTAVLGRLYIAERQKYLRQHPNAKFNSDNPVFRAFQQEIRDITIEKLGVTQENLQERADELIMQNTNTLKKMEENALKWRNRRFGQLVSRSAA